MAATRNTLTKATTARALAKVRCFILYKFRARACEMHSAPVRVAAVREWVHEMMMGEVSDVIFAYCHHHRRATERSVPYKYSGIAQIKCINFMRTLAPLAHRVPCAAAW